jgi:hypothetical protein
VDDSAADEDFTVLAELVEGEHALLPLSTIEQRYIGSFKQAVFDELKIMRVFSKPPGEDADLEAPFVLEAGSTLEEFAGKVHQDFLQGLKSARIWGKGVHPGQLVGREHILQDGDVVELRL